MAIENMKNMRNKIAFFHTTTTTVQMLKQAFEKRYPNEQLITMVDDSILPEVLENGNQPTPDILRRLILYGQVAQEQGARVFVCMCTTLGLALRKAQEALIIPMISIDQPMLQEAVQKGDRIALLITFAPTADISRETALAFAADIDRDVKVDVILAKGAREALNQGDKDTHDRIIAETAQNIASEYDLLVFAQVSMTDAAKICMERGMKVLYALDSGLEQIDSYLEK